MHGRQQAGAGHQRMHNSRIGGASERRSRFESVCSEDGKVAPSARQQACPLLHPFIIKYD